MLQGAGRVTPVEQVMVLCWGSNRCLHSSSQEHGESSSRGSSSEDSEENSEEASDLSDSELDADSYYFLQVSCYVAVLPRTRQRAHSSAPHCLMWQSFCNVCTQQVNPYNVGWHKTKNLGSVFLNFRSFLV